MANPTLFQLATTTVGSGGVSSVTFSAIPQTYTDLLIKGSARATTSVSNWVDIDVTINGSTSNFSFKELYGTGSSAAASNGTTGIFGYSNGSVATANTFSNFECYIPNYTSSNYKSFSADSVTENNATAALAIFDAGLWSNTAAITSISLAPNGTNFLQYSTFTLYGIRNY